MRKCALLRNARMMRRNCTLYVAKMHGNLYNPSIQSI